MQDKLDHDNGVDRVFEWHDIGKATAAAEQNEAGVSARGDARKGSEEYVLSPAYRVQGPACLHEYQHGNITIGGAARVQMGDTILNQPHGPLHGALACEGTTQPAYTSFTGTYAYSSLNPVATYIPRLKLERQLLEQLPALRDPARISETRTVVVWGLGGAGKSQLIHKLLFPNVAQNGRVIPVEDAVTAVKCWFHGRDGRSLWVMDSADVIDDEADPFYIDLNRYLPEAPGIDIIITTRSSHAQSMSSQSTVIVAEMTSDEAVQLFQTCVKLHNPSEEAGQQILTIVSELGCLALAVTLAASYVHETPWLSSNLARYVDEYRAQRKPTLSQKARPHEHRYNDSVLSAWEMSFAAVERQSPVAVRLLNLAAFLNHDDIFLDLFASVESLYEAKNNQSRDKRVELRSIVSRVFRRKKRPSRTTAKSGSQENVSWIELLSSEGTTIRYENIVSGFKTLQTYSLVSWRASQKAYSMHKLVHACAYERLDIEQRQAWSLAAMRLLGEVILGKMDDLSWQTRMVPHVMANFSAMSAACGPPYRLADCDPDVLLTLGNLLKRLGRWDDEYGVRWFLTQAATEGFGPEHPRTLTSMNQLAVVLRKQGQYEEAEKMIRQTLKLRKKVLGPEHPETLLSMKNLAGVLRNQGQYEEAENMIRQTLKLRKKVLGPEHPDTLMTMNSLAGVLGKQGQHEEAEKMIRQMLKPLKKVLGPEHPETLMCMNNLARVLREQGQYEEAEKMDRQTVKLRKEVLGPKHPDTLKSMKNLAWVLSEQGQYEEAEEIRHGRLEVS